MHDTTATTTTITADQRRADLDRRPPYRSGPRLLHRPDRSRPATSASAVPRRWVVGIVGCAAVAAAIAASTLDVERAGTSSDRVARRGGVGQVDRQVAGGTDLDERGIPTWWTSGATTADVVGATDLDERGIPTWWAIDPPSPTGQAAVAGERS